MKTVNKNTTPSTQKYLKISEIKEDCIIMKDGTLRAVVLASSMNFALKSEDEQNAVISSYMSFLNSLDFPIQIIVQSRRLNLDNYLASLEKAQANQKNDLLKLQTAEYKSYIEQLLEMEDIMTKKFFIVVSYDELTDSRAGYFKRLGDVLSPVKLIKLNHEQFQKRKDELTIRVEKVMSVLSSVGLSCRLLDTQSIIELFYTMYNPIMAKTQDLVDINKLRIEDDV